MPECVRVSVLNPELGEAEVDVEEAVTGFSSADDDALELMDPVAGIVVTPVLSEGK